MHWILFKQRRGIYMMYWNIFYCTLGYLRTWFSMRQHHCNHGEYYFLSLKNIKAQSFFYSHQANVSCIPSALYRQNNYSSEFPKAFKCLFGCMQHSTCANQIRFYRKVSLKLRKNNFRNIGTPGKQRCSSNGVYSQQV